MHKKYLGIKEVAAEYGFAVKTLYKWVGANKIPYYRVNGVLKFSPEKLDNWMKGKEVKVKSSVV